MAVTGGKKSIRNFFTLCDNTKYIGCNDCKEDVSRSRSSTKSRTTLPLIIVYFFCGLYSGSFSVLLFVCTINHQNYHEIKNCIMWSMNNQL